jgi:hypothetical protein
MTRCPPQRVREQYRHGSRDHVGVVSPGSLRKTAPALPSSPIGPALEQLQDLPASDRALLSGRCPSLAGHLGRVPDPRDPRGVRHTLTSLLLPSDGTTTVHDDLAGWLTSGTAGARIDTRRAARAALVEALPWADAPWGYPPRVGGYPSGRFGC